MALPHYAYRDPLDQLIKAEEFTCRGCANQARNELFGTVVFTCSLKNADGTPKKHGRRCPKYQEQGRDA
ncbi:conserved hypothetical protein [Cupriavidus necator]|uniref:Uncharacterized protein n=1 Tax=Cupriavidus necator TaxID=106590 RepID=A0A1K0IEE6_CUPNE|nr:conserved hypothetical protein [Cupriavidus necator]